MTEDRYEPASDFLKAVIADEVPLVGSDFAEINLRQLIAMTRDSDISNRDWATMLLSQHEIDTAEVRQALLAAARDSDSVVRAEAILGLALRDRIVALPLAKHELASKIASIPLFEAAEIIAHPSLAPLLRSWIEPSDDEFCDRAALRALAACGQGEQA
jgi:hypothetical protein